jgi:hypothetical protein
MPVKDQLYLLTPRASNSNLTVPSAVRRRGESATMDFGIVGGIAGSSSAKRPLDESPPTSLEG